MTTAERVTSGEGNDQLLYFTTSSLDEADRRLWFVSDKSGHENIHLLELDTGRERQLTDNLRGRMWQYQGFEGEVGRGLAVWSVALDPPRGLLYYIQDDQIRCVDPDGSVRVLARVPAGQTTAFIHVSDCGRWLCVPTTDVRALPPPGPLSQAPGGAQGIDRRCQELGLSSFLRVYDTASGAEACCVAVPRCWITHVQFRPGRPEEILYNHEWPADVGVRRMWLWDGKRHTCLRPAGDGRSPADWVCHEVWAAGGETVIYHGGLQNGPAMVGRRVAATGAWSEITLPAGWHRYGHFTPAPRGDALLVCDGYYEQADDAPQHGQWISLARADWRQGTLSWTPLCRHGSSWTSQDSHPHPIFDHAGNHVYYTGAVEGGRRAVFRVAAR